MKGWILIPNEYYEKWIEFAEKVVEYVDGLEK